MSLPMRCILASFLVALIVCATQGTLQHARFASCLSTQSVLHEGTTRPDQLTERFAQSFLLARFLDLSGDLTAAQRERFWIGNWYALGTSLVTSPIEWAMLIAGLGCAFALFPALVAIGMPGFRRAFDLSTRRDRRSALEQVMWQTTRHVSWIVICCTPVAWWLMSDRYAGQTAFSQWPQIHAGPLAFNGIWLVLAVAAYWSTGLAHIFARRAAFRHWGNSGLCAECGYNCTGLKQCPECGLTVGQWAPTGQTSSKDRRTVMRLATVFCIGLGATAVFLGRPDSLGVRWFFFQQGQPVSPLIFARPMEVLELRCGDQTFLVAWRVEFLPPVGRQAMPDSVVSAVLKPGFESRTSDEVQVDRALSGVFNTSGALAHQLHIPSGPAQLKSSISAFEAQGYDEFVNSMIALEFSCVSEVRRWDPGSDDPRVRRVVSALQAVSRGAGSANTIGEDGRTGE